MRILIIDRDRSTSQTLQNWLQDQGHDVVVEPVRKTAMDLINAENFDMIAIDPAPLPSAHQITLPLRWEQRANYFYLVLLGHDMDDHEVVRSGMNDKMLKPFDERNVMRTMDNAQRLTSFMARLQQDDSGLTVENRIFGQRAFYQLVLSALDRAYRYQERTFLLVIQVTNIELLKIRLGEARMNQMMEELGTYLGRLHRISDFLGQTDKTEFMLLLLRPAVDTEPQDAAERFAIALRDFQSQIGGTDYPRFNIELWALPSASIAVQTILE